MQFQDLTIERATEADVDAILALDAKDTAQQGGAGAMDRADVCRTIEQIPCIVARQDARVVGFLLAWEKPLAHPVVTAMLEAYPGGQDSYIYGPICVEGAFRGRGIAGAMFEELRRYLEGREGILFIRADNQPSLRAHRKMQMAEVARFTWNGVEYLAFAFRG